MRLDEDSDSVKKPNLPFLGWYPVRLGMQVATPLYSPYQGGGRVVRKTAPTGPGENIKLPKYFLKLHPDCVCLGTRLFIRH